MVRVTTAATPSRLQTTTTNSRCGVPARLPYTPKPPIPPRLTAAQPRRNGHGLAVNFKNYPPPLTRNAKMTHASRALFEDLVKTRGTILRNDHCERQFLAVVRKMQKERIWWIECKRERDKLRELVNLRDKDCLVKDHKINQARKLVEDESRARIAVEHKRDELAKQLDTLRNILLKNSDNGQHLDHDTLERVRRLDTTPPYSAAATARRLGDGNSNRRDGRMEESIESILDVSELSFDDTNDFRNTTNKRLSVDDKLASAAGVKHHRRRSSAAMHLAEKRRQSRHIMATSQHRVDVESSSATYDDLEGIHTDVEAGGGMSTRPCAVNVGLDGVSGEDDVECLRMPLGMQMRKIKQAARQSRERRSEKFAAIRVVAEQTEHGLADVRVEAVQPRDGVEVVVQPATPVSNENGSDQRTAIDDCLDSGCEVGQHGSTGPSQQLAVKQRPFNPHLHMAGASANVNLGVPTSSIPQRAHYFVEKKMYVTVYCCVCQGRILFQRLHVRCRECQATCHVECRSRISMPCIVIASARTPSSHAKRAPSDLANIALTDIAPYTTPSVPTMFMYCIREVEHRGLDQVGIYRVSGNEADTVELFEKLMRYSYGGATSKMPLPPLAKCDIHVVTSVLKKMLRMLKEAIIPDATRQLMIDATTPQTREAAANIAAENGGSSHIRWADLTHTIERMPRPNRDTLAQLMVHLQIVAALPACKMPVSNLATVMGPTLVGYSSNKPIVMMAESQLQQNILTALLNLPTAYWQGLLAVPAPDEGMKVADEATTPPPNPPYKAVGDVGSCVAKRTRSRTFSEQDAFKSPLLV